MFHDCSKLWLLALCGVVIGANTPQDRVKRDFTYSAPIYYDQKPVQTPAPAPAKPQQQLTQQGFQGIPILGALVGNIPGLSGLTQLVPLANLGNLGNLGGLFNVGGLLPGIGLPQTQQQRCPLGQISRCRCENLLQIPQPKESTDSLEILQQNIKLNKNGQTEISARLNNGLQLYQRSGSEKLNSNNQSTTDVQGYYTLRVKDNKYLTIYYVITDTDYTVKADVTMEPPKSDLDETPQLPEFKETH